MSRTVVHILANGDIAELARNDRTDGQLLDLFVRARDEEAFAAVVRRHGPMVLAVCRRILRNAADADDAFQAAFLVLARKAASIGARELLAQWLHGVAYNTARKLREANARRALREKPLAELPEPLATTAGESHAELVAILDEELLRLPEQYRTAIVLCDLEGTTRREAARQLGWPEGTVAGRLARARAMLAERLAGRGVTVPAAMLVTVLGERPALAVVSCGELLGAVAPRVAETTERVVQAMFISKLKSTAVAVAMWGVALATIAGAVQLSATAQPPATPGADNANVAAGDRIFTHIPLTAADPREMTRKLNALFPKSVTVAAVRDEPAVIIYATRNETEQVLRTVRFLEASADPPPLSATAEPKRYAVNFQQTPWTDVLKWYAEVSALTPVFTAKPTGAVTLTPPKDRRYTIGEITDLLNEAMMTQKFILFRRQITFTIVPSDEKIDISQVPRIELADLPHRGKTELVQVLLPLKSLAAEETAPEVRRMLTPFGTVSVLAKLNTLVIVDTAGNIHRIAETLRQVEEQVAKEPGKLPGGDLSFDPRPRDPRLNPPKKEDDQPPTTVPQTFAVDFTDTPWTEVLAWYEKQSGLTAIYNKAPTGKATIQAPKDRRFTLAEVTDLINESLMAQKLLLVRGQLSFTLLPTDQAIDPSLLPRIELAELPSRGKTELVQVLIPLKALSAADTLPEVQKLLTPHGNVTMVEKANTLIVTDLAGNINRIVEAIQIPHPNRGEFLSHKFNYRKASEEAEKLSKLLADKHTTVTVTGVARSPYYDPRYDPRYGPREPK